MRDPCTDRRFTSLHSKLTADNLVVMFRKLGAKFTQKDLDALMKQLDPTGDGTCSFKEFAVGLAMADRSKLGGLADVFKCAPPLHCFFTLRARVLTSCLCPRQRRDAGVHRVLRAHLHCGGAGPATGH